MYNHLFATLPVQLATVGAGVDVVKVVERQPALLLVDDSSPLSDWSQLDPEELQQQIQVSSSQCTPPPTRRGTHHQTYLQRLSLCRKQQIQSRCRPGHHQANPAAYSLGSMGR